MKENDIVKKENDVKKVAQDVSGDVEKTSRGLKWQIWLAVIFTVIGFVNLAVYLPLCIAGVIEMREIWWLFVIGFFVCVWLPMILQLLFKIDWSFGVVLVFDIYIFFAILVGSLWNVYALGFGFDKIVHIIGGAMWAVLPFDFLKNSSREKNISSGFLAVFLVSFSMMCGGVWEIYEYVSDGIMGNDAQHSGDLVGRAALADTMQDLICDLAGAILAAVGILIYIHLKKRKERTSDEKSEA